MFAYQKNHRFFAQIYPGLEEPAAAELTELGAKELRHAYLGIYFTAGMPELQRIVYCARLIVRVLAPLYTFRCRGREDLYRAGKTVHWSRILSPRESFAVHANVSDNQGLRHSQFAALCLKDALVDQFRQRTGRRPNVVRIDPDRLINLHIKGQNGTISLDVSGGSLHRRGYRQRPVEAPMQEILAAAMVAFSGWRGERLLYDPMCGGGTLLSEALMAYCRIPAGFLKQRLGFEALPDFQPAVWEQVRKAADGAIRDLPEQLIQGSDISWPAVRAAQINCAGLPGGTRIKITPKDFNDIPGLENCTILCNPPYGVRLGDARSLPELYARLGAFLKHRCRGADAYIYCGNRELIPYIGLKATWKKPLKNAGLDGRLLRFALY